MGVLTQAAQNGFTHFKKIKYNDVTETVSGTEEVITAFTIPTDAIVGNVAYYLKTDFAGGSVSALTIEIGDDDDDNGYVEANSILSGDTPISSAVSDGAYHNDGTTANAVNGKVYDNAATKSLTVTLNPTGDALTALTAGEVYIFANIIDLTKEI